MNTSLKNKVIVITGGSSGLGEQLAYAVARRQGTVVVCARRQSDIQRVAEECRVLSSCPSFSYQLDISRPESIDDVVAQISEEVGAIDVLINCAGFGLFRNFIETEFSIIEKMFKVNVIGLMYLTQKVAIEMAERKSGHIIMIGSQAGKMATAKSAVYAATKHAVLGFSNALRLEMKPFHVRVTTVNPGPIATAFFETADETGNYLANVGKLVLQPIPLAEKIVSIIGKNKREINEPFIMEMASKAYVLFPKLGDYLASTVFNKK